MKKEKIKKTVSDIRVPKFNGRGRMNIYFDSNYKNCIDAFKKRKLDFATEENFNCKKIVWLQGEKIRRRIFTFAYTHNSLFVMNGYVKRNIESKIIDKEKINLLNVFKVQQRYVYKEKNCLTGYQYDVKNAYTTFLRCLPLLDKDVYEKLLQFKENGTNINKILGMSLLGTKYISDYRNGKKVSVSMSDGENVKINPLTPIFNFAYYLCTATVSKLCERFNENVVARYSDSFIVNKRLDTDFLEEKIIESCIEVVTRVNQSLLKYHGITLNNIFKTEEEDSLIDLFKFHEQQIDSVIYTHDEYNRREFSFIRETKDKTGTEKVTYKTNEQNQIFA